MGKTGNTDRQVNGNGKKSKEGNGNNRNWKEMKQWHGQVVIAIRIQITPARTRAMAKGTFQNENVQF